MFLDTTERQTSLTLNLISALRPVLAAFSGCEQTPRWIPSSPSLLCSSFALSETLTQNHSLLHNSCRKEKNREMFYIYLQKYVSLIRDVWCFRFSCVDTSDYTEEFYQILLCIRSEEVQSPSLTNLFFILQKDGGLHGRNSRTTLIKYSFSF